MMLSRGRALAKQAIINVPRIGMVQSASFFATKAGPMSPQKPVERKKSKLMQKNGLADHILKTLLQEESTSELIDKEYEDVKKMVLQSYTLVEKPGQSHVQLHRKYKNQTILVEFDVQDEVELPPLDMGDEDNKEEQSGFNFRVTITKENSNDRLIFHCVAALEMAIATVQILPNFDPTNCKGAYLGPLFHHLDNRMQNALAEYLKERGIDDDFNYFINAHCIQKEQQEYLTFLRSHLDFIDP